MSGHGHVTPNASGVKARCGGPKMCRVCAIELAQKNRLDNSWQKPEKIHHPCRHAKTCPARLRYGDMKNGCDSVDGDNCINAFTLDEKYPMIHIERL